MNNRNSNDRDPLVPITGLWPHEDRNGNTYFSGTSGSNRWLVLPVMGEDGKDPSFRLYISSCHLSPKDPQEEEVYEESTTK